MAGRGPTASQDPVRRNSRGSGQVLPAEGRTGEPPQWPLRSDVTLQAKLDVLRAEQVQLERLLDGCEDPKGANKIRYRLGKNVEAVAVLEATIRNASEVELEIWAEAWSTPQAVAWERLRWTREVAQYVRWKAMGELGDLNAAKEARMLADRLGLTPQSLQSLRWTIASDEVGAKRQETKSARGRIKAV